MKFLLAAAACAALLQEAAKIDQEVAYANDPEKLQFQIQAVKRLKERGAAAVPALPRRLRRSRSPKVPRASSSCNAHAAAAPARKAAACESVPR